SISITATSTPAGANHITSWTNECTAQTTSPCTFAAATTETVTANFVPTTVSITAAATAGLGSVSITDAGAPCANPCVANVGASIAITATSTPAGANHITSWTNECTAQTTSPCTFLAATTETVTANLAVTVVTITAVASGSGTVAISDSTNPSLCAGNVCNA